MKKILSSLLLLLPLLVAAQAEPGTYILVDNRQVVYHGKLKIVHGELRARDDSGKRQVWQPDEVYWARVGTQAYLPAKDFQIPNILSFRPIAYGLAAVLDSGRLTLLRYDYEVGGPGTMGANGSMGGMGSMTNSAYLLQLPTEESAQLIPMNYLSGKGADFKAMLAPYFASRPDLVQLLEKGEISRRNLAAFVHAFNTKQPFVAPRYPGPPADVTQD